MQKKIQSLPLISHYNQGTSNEDILERIKMKNRQHIYKQIKPENNNNLELQQRLEQKIKQLRQLKSSNMQSEQSFGQMSRHNIRISNNTTIDPSYSNHTQNNDASPKLPEIHTYPRNLEYMKPPSPLKINKKCINQNSENFEVKITDQMEQRSLNVRSAQNISPLNIKKQELKQLSTNNNHDYFQIREDIDIFKLNESKENSSSSPKKGSFQQRFKESIAYKMKIQAMQVKEENNNKKIQNLIENEDLSENYMSHSQSLKDSDDDENNDEDILLNLRTLDKNSINKNSLPAILNQRRGSTMLSKQIENSIQNQQRTSEILEGKTKPLIEKYEIPQQRYPYIRGLRKNDAEIKSQTPLPQSDKILQVNQTQQNKEINKFNIKKKNNPNLNINSCQSEKNSIQLIRQFGKHLQNSRQLALLRKANAEQSNPNEADKQSLGQSIVIVYFKIQAIALKQKQNHQK
ncbi:UNKNOWN [Stylonychia lemnae]|uniref:Uncharacterized protein n=1 Tax=Stylonychia lemnae TaxID=5949 RepID=A0A078A077_STYLE|nr:UNKNOWN [Stylonychia lemnae]|eukprot:CDW75287.1 UNKNOWN [Stylonychia lemnae]